VYLEIDEGFTSHPKTLRFAALMQDPNAPFYLMRLWSWACRSAPDGDLSMMDATAIEFAVGYRNMDGRCFGAMVKAGFLDADEHGSPMRIHNWDQRTGGSIERMRQRADLKRIYREERRQTPAGGVSVQGMSMGQSIGQSVDSPVDVHGTNQPRQDKTSPVQTDLKLVGSSGTDSEPTEPKKFPYAAEFEKLWTGVGRGPGNKFPAYEAWKNRGKPTADVVIASWFEWRKTLKWREGFVPHVATWLNARGWEDDPRNQSPAKEPIASPLAAIVARAVSQTEGDQR
jgi:hypothetical protein